MQDTPSEKIMNFWDTPATVTSIVLACLVPSGQGEAEHRNRSSHGLALNLAGHKVYRFADGTKIDVPGGKVIFLPEHSSYSVFAEAPGDCYAVNFRLSENANFSPFLISIRNLPPLRESFVSAEAAFRTRNVGWRETCLSDLYRILSLLQKERTALYTPTGKAGWLTPATERIHESFCDGKLNIEDLAALCGISTVYFRRLFHRVYGVSPMQYIQRLRLERSKELIASGLYTVEKTAELSGFSDTCYFCRCFRSQTGVTPTEYRRRRQEEDLP